MFVRWDAQRTDVDDGRLPGIGSGGIVRTFDAPEALGINFHEVEAKSVLNHVPGDRFGFSWTINAFRGCAHACLYCQGGETPILMGDGRTKPLRDLAVGDEVFGTASAEGSRRYTRTAVLAHWSTRKRAYRIALSDGRELVASADHRFLADGEWCLVAAGQPSEGRVLLSGTQLMGPGVTGSVQHPEGPVEPSGGAKVVAIEPLPGELDLFDITTGTGDFIANGVVSHNCFARPTHTYLGFDAGRDFEREIVVKVNAPEVLRRELARPTWKRDLVAIGTNTDPYQWVEGRYRFMPEILEALADSGTPVSVLTKSPLALRDIDIYERMATKVDVSVNFSVPTLDEKVWRQTEPHTPSPRARLEAVAEFKRRGISSGVLVAPLMPGINDAPEQVRPIEELARAAGADFAAGIALHLRGEVREVFFGWLEAKRPDLLPEYERLFEGGRAYMRPEERQRVARVFKGWGRSRAGRRPRPVGRKPAQKASTTPGTNPQATLF